MTAKQIAPYGSWPSPVTPELMTGKTVGLGGLAVDGSTVYWLEGRPNEGGRTALLRWTQTEGISLVTPAPINIGSRVHEYGGGSYAVSQGRILFSDKRDGSVWLIQGMAAPSCLIAVDGCRYADFVFDDHHHRFLAIREDHRNRPETDPKAALIAFRADIPPAENEGVVLIEGPDFLSSPRLSPDGGSLAWLAWDHPDMPWDATRLYLAPIATDGQIGPAHLVAGSPGAAITQPHWSPGGRLYFCWDRSGWWNLYTRTKTGDVVAVTQIQAEIGGPHWNFKPRYFDFRDETTLIAILVTEGRRHAITIKDGAIRDLGLGPLADCPIPYGDGLLYLAMPPDAPMAIYVQAATGDAPILLRQAGPPVLQPADISLAESIRFPTADGFSGHAFFYPPQNAGYAGPADSLPPLLVVCHGGPTSMANFGFSLGWQWWTSRGFAVIDVNYGGSTGFGRAYQMRLNGAWGVVDIDDCVAAAQEMIRQGRVDPARIAIRGGSAGGFTALAALARSTLFSAGASHYGIGDLKRLALDTHKFESRYLDRLIGPLPEAAAIYEARSPLNQVSKIRCPVIFFQGEDDKIVPPNQALAMVAALRQRGLRADHYSFAGEGHGFRKAETIRQVITKELEFYGEVFGFTPADPDAGTSFNQQH